MNPSNKLIHFEETSRNINQTWVSLIHFINQLWIMFDAYFEGHHKHKKTKDTEKKDSLFCL